jgi:hypothetical protein
MTPKSSKAKIDQQLAQRSIHGRRQRLPSFHQSQHRSTSGSRPKQLPSFFTDCRFLPVAAFFIYLCSFFVKTA